ncbi:hypothetical protein GCM10023091_00050 [Ravibacter arvi]|uniref:Secretion system C-terminal sorting domain-containing protein n=1 Tax=Ravibacter arvi TaxID=2051041 RepID=A0ABP8LIX9_9BACT
MALTNGNYVVRSPSWRNGDIATAGAVTWRRGDIATSGIVSTANSLVGSTASDLVGLGVVALSNGNYVVSSELWNNGDASAAGAATWGNGTTGTVGVVGSDNSLVGGKYLDKVGKIDPVTGLGVIALSNGHYVVRSPDWDNGDVEDAGAVAWGNGITGTSGIINSSNSLIGNTAYDRIGNVTKGVVALKNGNYLVKTPNWGAGIAFSGSEGYGAVTWGNGNGGTTGVINATNSLIGSKNGDRLGEDFISGEGVTILNNGDYVVTSPRWDNGTLGQVGAVTWGNGTTGTVGLVSPANSLVGSIPGEMVGSGGITALRDGNYVAKSAEWSNSRGALSLLGYGAFALTGPINTCNSVVGGQYQGVHWSVFAHNEVHGYLVVGFPRENKVVIYNRQNISLAVSSTNTAATISGSGRLPFTDSQCQLLLSLSVEGASMGNTLAKVWIDDTQNAAYVKRHYEITPATNTTTSTAKVTLYFTQSDFDDFNLTNQLKLPVGENDAAGKANLLIEKRPGSSTGDGTPTSYSGTPINIDPADEDIVWNSELDRWEVSFNITGFSGFFVKTTPSPLPVTLVDFSAEKQENTVVLRWQTTVESNSDHFEIQRSSDAQKWTGIGKVQAKGESQELTVYTFNDGQPFLAEPSRSVLYYRLKIADKDASSAYSRIASVRMENTATIIIYPNPAIDEITFSGSVHVNGYRILNPDGHTILEKRNIDVISGKIALPFLQAGLYHLELYGKGGYRRTHKIVISR